MARHEDRRDHADPQQRHHREPKDLAERKQPVFEQLQYVQRRLQSEKSPPEISASEATASVQTGIAARARHRRAGPPCTLQIHCRPPPLGHAGKCRGGDANGGQER